MKKTVIRAFALVLAFCMLFGCASNIPASAVSDHSSNSNVSSTDSGVFQVVKPPVTSVLRKFKSIEELNSSMGKFSESVTDFGLNLLSKLPHDGKTSVISPVSLTIPLSLLANGATGETYKELIDLYGIENLDKWNEQMSAYLDFLYKNSKLIYYRDFPMPDGKTTDSVLKLGNAVWVDKAYPANPDFIKTGQNYYGAEIQNINLTSADAADRINAWANAKTGGLAEKLVDNLDQSSLVLSNTAVFDYRWNNVYQETSLNDFHAYDGSTAKVSFLCSDSLETMGEEGLLYIGDSQSDGFVQYYDGGNFYFAALLPDEGVDIYDYAASLSGSDLQNILKNRQKRTVVTWLPAFNAECDFDCVSLLKELGVNRIFSSNKNELSKCFQSKNGTYVGDIMQKAGIKVTEYGTLAYAATYIIGTTGIHEPKDPITIKLDRPFLYVIADEEYDIPLFIGIVAAVEPATGE